MTAARSPKLLALDFDGVICDTAREAFRSAWQVCRNLKLVENGAPSGLGDAFVRNRPVAEIGYEFPVLVLALRDGAPDAELEREFQQTWRPRILRRYGLTQEQLTTAVDEVRDRAIRKDLNGWLSEQGLYPGVGERLRTLLADSVSVFIITTKEGRFAQKLLEVNGVQFPADRIWGKEQARPKSELLRQLVQSHGLRPGAAWFVEDRLKTLQAVAREQDLAEIGLFFATWGYTLASQRAEAAGDPRIVSLTLPRFSQDFPAWLAR